ncbi:MAG: FtsQ-type POTRA domain-containing protein [Labilithrix sp.]|nr:FtsQ-type POTRA domain-containing protein [Labilithrix sp.]MBX3220467.1 FtsQ-type POTRA domain-containing protein [Labilithrix sp.]
MSPPSVGPRSVGLEPAKNVRKRARSSGSLPPPVSGDVPPPAAVTPRPRAGDSRLVRALRAVVGLALVVGIGWGVVWGARRYVRTSPRFAVSEIITSGGKRRGPEDIASIAGIAKGQNVFSLDLDRARARLSADPWIESAEVGRQLPGTISIRVTEREAAGVVAVAEEPNASAPATPSGTYLVTRDGAIIKRVDADDPIDFHVVTGLLLKTLVEDREGATRTIRRALDLAYDYDRSPLAQRSPVQEVHVEPNGDMTLVVGKSGVVLRMGAGPYRRKLDQAVRIVGELDRRGAKPETIMLDDEARPDRVVVRMR